MVARTRSGTINKTGSNNSNSKGILTANSTSVTTISNKSHITVERNTKNQNNNGNNSTQKYDESGRPHQHHHFSVYPKIDQAIQTMKASLGRFTRANDRRMVLRTLKDVKYLKALPIESRPPPMLDVEELESEVAKENLVLNGQAFYRKTKYGRTSTDFLHVLHELCYHLCDDNHHNSATSIVTTGNSSGGGPGGGVSVVSSLAVAISPDTLYYDLLCRLARTITSADCFAKLHDILGSNDLILMNSSAERKPKVKKPSSTNGKTGNNNNNTSNAAAPAATILAGEMSSIPPIELNIFEEGGNIHAHIVTTLGYGLYRKLDVNTGRPWIKLQAELNERMNFSTGAQVRHVTVHWPDMYV